MNTTKAIIILVVFVVGLVLGYRHFVVNAPLQQEEIIMEEGSMNENGEIYPIDMGIEIPTELPYYDPAGGTFETGKTPDQLCLSAGGAWSQEYLECLGVSGEVCQEIGGNWNECASACRNNPNAEVCTMQCVQVCEFKSLPIEAM